LTDPLPFRSARGCMFVDQPWDDADSASLYDAFPFTEDLAFYAGLAGTQGGPVLELGCGSGRILVPLARGRRPGSGGGRGGRGGGRIRRARGAARRRRRCHRAWFSSVAHRPGWRGSGIGSRGPRCRGGCGGARSCGVRSARRWPGPAAARSLPGPGRAGKLFRRSTVTCTYRHSGQALGRTCRVRRAQ
jgi:hypothetical protein